MKNRHWLVALGSIIIIISCLLIIGNHPAATQNRPANHSAPSHTSDDPEVNVTDTQHLRQSAWFAIVSKQIIQDMYHFHRQADRSIRSDNPSQGLTGEYAYNRMHLASAQLQDTAAVKHNRWQLDLQLDHIAFNDGETYLPSKAAGISQQDSSLVFDQGGNFKVQYLNTAEGVRQNFIVSRAPEHHAAAIRVQLSVVSSLRAYVAAGGKEIHFARRATAKGGLQTEVVYNSLRAWDANGASLHAIMTADERGRTIGIDVDAENAAYPVTIDPLSTTASTTLNGAASGNKFGYSVASAGDVNGDGYSDVLVGTSAANIAYAYYGSASGLSTTASWTTTQSSGSYGSAVATAGDVNGDGYSDVIIGEPGNNKVFVYYGSSSGLAATAAWTATQTSGNFGSSVSLAGDVNGDGYSDVIIGASGANKAYCYYGGSGGPATTASWSATGTGGYGVTVAAAGDVNGDSYSDVIVGTSTGNMAYAYYGSASGLATSASWSSPAGTSNFGYSVAAAGDVNGDGYTDVIIGAYGSNNAYVYYGSGSGILSTGATTLTGATGSLYGYSVASAGDVNGDGYSDVIVGTNGGNNAFVYYGSSTGTSTTAAWTGTGTGSYGYSVASAGDVNGDGFSDVIVGANGLNTNTGAAYIYTGSAAGTTTADTWSYIGSAGQTGFKVASAGDVNSDGYSDVLVGVLGVPVPLGGGSYTGAAYLFMGSASGLSTTPAWSQTGTASSNYGVVAAAGDVNGDGYSDVIVGATGFNSNAGRAYVYYGSASGLSTTPSWTGNGAAANCFYGYSLGCAGDVNADGYSDIIVGTYATGGNTGAAYVYYGSASGPSTTPSWTGTGASGSYYGGAVASAGDVNGDGYSDILVSAPGVGSAAGAVFMYYGSSSGLQTSFSWITAGSTAGVLYGISVASAGDVNGDGFSDVIIGSSGVPPGGGVTGKAYIFTGSSSGLSSTAAWTGTATASNTCYGWSVASAGDVNGDGYSDVIVGAFGNSGNTGAAYLYYGSASGVSTTAAWTGTGTAANSYYGGSVASAGDVNGDGYSDIITAPYGKATATATAYLYSGNNNASNNAGNLQLFNTDLVTPISAANLAADQVGVAVRPVSFTGRVNARIAWDEEGNGIHFTQPASTITQSASVTGNETSYSVTAGGTTTTDGLTTVVSKALIMKLPYIQDKIRVRMQYSPVTAITGQVYGPWKYSAAYMAGNQAQMTLPVELTQFTGMLTSGGRVLDWSTAQESAGSRFELQRSTDARQFIGIDTMAATGNSLGSAYTYTDACPLPGVNVVYYRLRIVEISGVASYSNTVAIGLGDAGDRLQLINTVVTGTANLQYTTTTSGSTYLRVVGLSGQVVMQQMLPVSAGVNSYSLDMQSLPKGMYVLQAAGNSIKFVKL
jgi:hypothetical protein